MPFLRLHLGILGHDLLHIVRKIGELLHLPNLDHFVVRGRAALPPFHRLLLPPPLAVPVTTPPPLTSPPFFAPPWTPQYPPRPSSPRGRGPGGSGRVQKAERGGERRGAALPGLGQRSDRGSAGAGARRFSGRCEEGRGQVSRD